MLPTTPMTKLELLKIIVGQARENGFEFRRWFTRQIGLSWISSDAAFAMLERERRYYGLLFSHEFASAFWKAGAEITFQVDRKTFQRTMPDGTVKTVSRKPYTRRSTRKDVWRYHLREMAVAEDPLRYIRKYLRVEEELTEDAEELKQAATTAAQDAARKPVKRSGRPLPTDLPAFLTRPYTPRG